jgi:DUF4097 and DUF4098 domain-containing protein YvlB
MKHTANRRAIALAALLAALPAVAHAGTVTETVDRTVPLPSSRRVVVQNLNGNVEVTSWDGDRVRLVAVKSARAVSDSRARAYLRDLQVQVVEEDGELLIRTRMPGAEGGLKALITCTGVDGHVNYRLQVPRGALVAATTVNGDVEVSRLPSPVRVASTNGSITVLEVRGEVDATSVNGNIQVDMRQAAARKPMELSTVNGSILVYLPAEFRGFVDARTTNGSVDSDLPLQVQGRRSRSRLLGSLNGGQTKLVLRTTNGSILLRRP